MEENKNKKKKLFISLPMSGRSDEDVVKDLNRIRDTYYPDYELIDQTKGYDPEWCAAKCLGHSIMIMGDADLVVMARGWEFARGCNIEKRICDEYGIPIEFEDQK